MFFMKDIDLIHMLDPIQYEFIFLFTTLADPEPEPKLRYCGSGSSQKFRLLAAPAPNTATRHRTSAHTMYSYISAGNATPMKYRCAYEVQLNLRGTGIPTR
jgi:hypothetical protein